VTDSLRPDLLPPYNPVRKEREGLDKAPPSSLYSYNISYIIIIIIILLLSIIVYFDLY